MFILPLSTLLNKNVPKNAFDKYTNSKQKKLISNVINKITWTNKISPETTNLQAFEITEIQLFTIELKVADDVSAILALINKAIPYHIIFTVIFQDDCFVTTSPKHSHPVNENSSVIDFTFTSQWYPQGSHPYIIVLNNNIDTVYKNFCLQFVEESSSSVKSVRALVNSELEKERLLKKITKIKADISKCRQFNKKVELNLALKRILNEYQSIVDQK